MPQKWTPRDGYGADVEPQRHPMLTFEEGKMKVNYSYAGEDAVLINAKMMPLTTLIYKLFEDPNFKQSTSFVAGTMGLLAFEVETPLLFSLFYSSSQGIGPTIDTITLSRAYQNLIHAAAIKFKEESPEEKKRYAGIMEAYAQEQDMLYEELTESMIKSTAFSNLRMKNEPQVNALIDFLIPYTLSWLTIMERHCWRLYARYSKKEVPTHIGTKLLPSVCDAPDKHCMDQQGELCIAWYKMFKTFWLMMYKGITMKNSYNVTDEKFKNSRYYNGVNVYQAVALFDILKQKSTIVFVPKPAEEK